MITHTPNDTLEMNPRFDDPKDDRGSDGDDFRRFAVGNDKGERRYLTVNSTGDAGDCVCVRAMRQHALCAGC